MSAEHRHEPPVVAVATGPSRAPIGVLPHPARTAWAGVAGSLAGLVATALALWLLRRDPFGADTLGRGWLASLSRKEDLELALGLTVIGVLGAVPHALVYEHVLRAAGWARGAALGFAQAVAFWVALGLVLRLAPRVADPFVYEIALLFDLGWAALAYLIVQVVYGAVMGAAYGPTRARARAGEVAVWRELLARERAS